MEAAASDRSRQRGWTFGNGEGAAGGDSLEAGPGGTFADRARSIAEDLRDGRPVSPEDIFNPRSRSCAIWRLSLTGSREAAAGGDRFDGGELARKYGLPPQNQEALKRWFAQKSEEEAKRWTALLASDNTRWKMSSAPRNNVRLDDGLDVFMAGLLPGDKYATFAQNGWPNVRNAFSRRQT
jgi:hypothetical protein